MELPWEDNLLERKVESDLKDLLKTLVAFANSVTPGHVAHILIGERDDGTVDGVTNPDTIQDRVRKECEKIYPPIIWRSRVYESSGKLCVRVEIEYSLNTPHFGGPAWIRKGSDTVKASDELFQKLIDSRLSFVRELNKWQGKRVTVLGDESTVPQDKIGRPGIMQLRLFAHRWPQRSFPLLVDVNTFWITFENEDQNKISEPLEKLTLNFDNERNQLEITIRF